MLTSFEVLLSCKFIKIPKLFFFYFRSVFFLILKNDTTNIIKLFQKLKTKFYIIIWSMGVIALNSSITKEINMKWYLIIRDKCWRCVNFSHPINAILKIKEYSHETIKCCLHKLWDDRLFFIFPDIIMVGIFFLKKIVSSDIISKNAKWKYDHSIRCITASATRGNDVIIAILRLASTFLALL